MKALPLQMTWTSETPTEPGWYWQHDRLGTDIVEVCERFGGQLFVMHGPCVEKLEAWDSDAIWYGPVEPPKVVEA